MKSKITFSVYYIAGILFVIFGLYQIYIQDWIESLLYLATGSAFIVIGMLQGNLFPSSKKVLDVMSWGLIIVALLSFLYILTIKPHVQ